MAGILGENGLISDDTRSRVLFEENKMKYIGNNPQRKQVQRYDIDGGMFNSERKKCDKALVIPDDKTTYFIELKGCDLKKAATQISETITILREKISGHTVHGRIICSRIPKPDIRSTQVVKLQQELLRYNGKLEKNSKVIEENI